MDAVGIAVEADGEEVVLVQSLKNMTKILEFLTNFGPYCYTLFYSFSLNDHPINFDETLIKK